MTYISAKTYVYCYLKSRSGENNPLLISYDTRQSVKIKRIYYAPYDACERYGLTQYNACQNTIVARKDAYVVKEIPKFG